MKSLTNADAGPIPCTYALLPALPSLLTEVTTVLLGAHSLFSNGAVYSRAGTALVAMMSKRHGVPVLVCCETYKFSEGVMVDGFGKNELGKLWNCHYFNCFSFGFSGSTLADSAASRKFEERAFCTKFGSTEPAL